MNNTIIFKSSFARVINEYLRIRQSQGVNIAHELTIMKELDQIMARHGKPVNGLPASLSRNGRVCNLMNLIAQNTQRLVK